MPQYSQRWLKITTPLGPDALLLEKLTGREEVSRPFQFDAEVLAPEPADFKKVLGKKATLAIEPREGPAKTIKGIVSEFQQRPPLVNGAGAIELYRYRARIVPRLWLLSRRRNLRIFQRLTVPDILAQLFKEWRLDVVNKLKDGYPEREYCVQYRETDLAFVSRLLEEEGIHYYFVPGEDGDQLVLADAVHTAPKQEPGRLSYDYVEGGQHEEGRVRRWDKLQRVCSQSYTLWDHCFELPDSHLNAEHPVPDELKAGKVTHAFSGSTDAPLEIYDYPGAYAHWFDGVDEGGAPQPNQLQGIFKQNARLARVRIEEELSQSLRIDGASDCIQLSAGHLFDLARHHDADGGYWLTRVSHEASVEGLYTSKREAALMYRNEFVCVPEQTPYRPERVTPMPSVQGTQTAVVVGPAGEEIFCDKFGRVKVQFQWDRQHQHNTDSSCWLRVTQAWAGKNYGMVAIPRVGQEVVVAFLEGNPDRPIIVGSVFNANQPVPFKLPDFKDMTCLKSHSVNGDEAAFSGLALHDTPGAEQVQLHAQRDMILSVEHDKQVVVAGTHSQTVGVNHNLAVHGSQTHTVGSVYRVSVGGPGGSGSGSGSDSDINWPWTYGANVPPVEGGAGAFVQDVWGLFEVAVIGAYLCTVAGDQTYFTMAGTYQNIVIGALNVNLTTLGVLANLTLGTATINWNKGPTYNLHDSGFTRVGLGPIQEATPRSIRFTAGAGISLIAGLDVMIDASADVTVMALGDITLSCGLSTLTMNDAGIVLDSGAASLEISSVGAILINGVNLDLNALLANYAA